uniref:Uncharacterized protein n=1 Tax=Takifugu rubripes TaxID=31033 RepID=A0A674N9N3_TAKRU
MGSNGESSDQKQSSGTAENPETGHGTLTGPAERHGELGRARKQTGRQQRQQNTPTARWQSPTACVALYDVVTNTMKYQHTAPVLDCAFSVTQHILGAGFDAQLKTHDLNKDQGMAQFCHRGSYILGEIFNICLFI